AHVPLERFTPKTLTTLDALDEEIDTVKRQGYALDDEEFLPGLICVAVLVPRQNGRSNMGIAVQGPIMRLNHDKVLTLLPALKRAAKALADIETQAENELQHSA
ncbi:MAG: IclR family transcriptional regulator, partial [Denitromonas halophila]